MSMILPYGGTLGSPARREGSGCISIHKANLIFASDKRRSILCRNVSDDKEKSFIALTPGRRNPGTISSLTLKR